MSAQHLSRRTVVMGLMAGSTLAVTGCSSKSGSSTSGGKGTITVSTFPFGVEEFTKAVIDPFTKKTGIKVKVVTGSNADRISQLKIAKGKPNSDVMLISDYYAAMGQATKLFTPVDAARVPNLGKLAKFAVDTAYDGPAYSYQLNGVLYDTGKFKAQEASQWELFGDPANRKKVALPDISATAGQLMVSGVAATYGSGPYDVDTAFAKLKSWAQGVLQFYKSSTEVTNLLTQGEIVAAMTLNGFATHLVESGQPVAWTPPATGRFMATNRAMIPTGASNLEGALAFIDYLLSVEAQSESARVVGDLPVNTGAEVPSSLTDVVGDVAKDPVAAGYRTLDPEPLVQHRSDWVARFSSEVVGG